MQKIASFVAIIMALIAMAQLSFQDGHVQLTSDANNLGRDYHLVPSAPSVPVALPTPLSPEEANYYPRSSSFRGKLKDKLRSFGNDPAYVTSIPMPSWYRKGYGSNVDYRSMNVQQAFKTLCIALPEKHCDRMVHETIKRGSAYTDSVYKNLLNKRNDQSGYSVVGDQIFKAALANKMVQRGASKLVRALSSRGAHGQTSNH